jgi:hypothetical protein
MSEAPYPPAEPPADGDRTNPVPPPPGSPRYAASASVPGSPGGQANPYGPVGQPPGGGQPPGSGRAAGSASVPPAPPTSYAPQGTSYGNPPQGYAGQAPTPGGVYGQQPYGAAPGGAPMGPPPASMGQPALGQPGSMGQPALGQPAPPAGGYAPPSYPPATDYGRDKMVPTGGWPYVGEVPAAPRKSRRGLIITIIALVVVFVVGVGGYIGWSLTTRGTTYKVGDCVRQNGSDGASVVGCTTTGSYRITSIVDTEAGCTDTTQPSLVLTSSGGKKQYACLVPTGG